MSISAEQELLEVDLALEEDNGISKSGVSQLRELVRSCANTFR